MSGAEFSECRAYRYSLWRYWNGCQFNTSAHECVAFIGLNPSTADETEDDPTIRRCIAFAKAWGFGAMFMLNIFAFRCKDPRWLKRIADPVGPINDEELAAAHLRYGLTVAAWGVHGEYRDRGRRVLDMLRNVSPKPVRCLGKTKDGHPKHPLYLRADSKLIDL